MKTNYILSSLLTASTILSVSLNARENIGQHQSGKTIEPNVNKIAAACTRAQTRTVFELNNVRTTLLTAGDMWWEAAGNGPRYEIPKDGGAHSLFAGALWIGGIDAGGQLKVAAMTYRQSGDDFWPGTLDTVSVTTDDTRCNYYDKHFRITRKEVEEFIGWNNNPADFPGYTVPSSILNWPANPYFTNETRSLAPYHDGNNNGVYDPPTTPDASGMIDYPNYNVTNSTTCDDNYLFGDETLWWVFNDMGDIHTESNGQAIGLEIQAQAFAFQTNDEINNMTFYKYKISNRSTFSINETYFGQWVDADLGGYNDDFVGCDVGRGLGYCYNGDNYDQDANGNQGYYDELPAVGVDFFEGPFVNVGGADLPKTTSNPASANGTGYGDGVPGNERAGMARFVYYNNDFSIRGNPENATHFYNYCSGFWKDGTPFTYGGIAKGGSTVCSFMYPGDTDPLGYGTNGVPQPTWTELLTVDGSPPATPADRRFFQSAGPFTLNPGAVNYVTVGAVWARAAKGASNTAPIDLMRAADDKAQSLFDNCFKVLDGPDSPDLTIQELDKQLLVYISNKATSNNYLEEYKERDPTISTSLYTDTAYEFEGYQIYQVKDPSVSASDLLNPDKARLVKQMDLQNSIGQIVNFEFDANLSANVPTEMVNGENKGIVHSFSITEDMFAQGNKTLVNHKQYYYMAIAYAENNFKQYDQTTGSGLDGQKKRYKPGRRNIKVYTGIPHIPSPEAQGTIANAAYGYGPKIRRIEGQGNGGLTLELTQATVDKIMSTTNTTHRDSLPEYENGKGPINVKVIDPLNVPSADFTFFMLDSVTPSDLKDAYWMLKNNTSGEVVYSNRTIAIADEYLISNWGLSVTVNQVVHPGETGTINNGLLASSITFTDPLKPWLGGIVDQDGFTTMNWIRSGVQTSTLTGQVAFNDKLSMDDDGIYEKVVGGTWAPYALAYQSDVPGQFGFFAPGGVHSGTGATELKYLSSVDVVLTNDKTKWTRCPVLEMNDETVWAIGGAPKFTFRRSPSVDKFGRKSGDAGTVSDGSIDDPNFIEAQGMGWFPGYAINVETGERLNMAFGEDSGLPGENGTDMIWNPTTTIYPATGGFPYFGGKHYIYIFNHVEDAKTQTLYDAGASMPRYDYGKQLRKFTTSSTNATPKNYMWRSCIWSTIPILNSNISQMGKNIDMPTDVKVRLRVAKPYQRGFSTQFITSPANNVLADTVKGVDQNNDRPMYTFNTYDIKTDLASADAAKDALDLINIVPNPYYAYSAYETSRIDNRVKITNLPEQCTVKIFTLNGSLIREFKIDQPATARNTMGTAVTSQDWDLKNQSGIPIASGLYIIHVDVPGVGEKILKWMGVMRPIDLESY